MLTVALIGPDGAGKTTVARRLQHSLPAEVAYLYMGVSADSSNHMLVTTRLVHAIKRARGAPRDTAGPPDPLRTRQLPAGRVPRVRSGLRAALRTLNRLAEEWHRQGLAWYHLRRGRIVIFDRHFFADYYAYDIAADQPRRLSRRVHGWLLAHVYPRPKLTIYLDAPAEVLLARKGEGTLSGLERRRQDYLMLADLPGDFAVIDATRTVDQVSADVGSLIEHYLENGGLPAWAPRAAG